MKEGSLDRPAGPLPAGAASSCSAGSSRSGEGEREGEREEGAAGSGGRAEAAAAPCAGEGGPAASEVGEPGVCLAGRWEAEGFLREGRGTGVKGPANHRGCPPPPREGRDG